MRLLHLLPVVIVAALTACATPGPAPDSLKPLQPLAKLPQPLLLTPEPLARVRAPDPFEGAGAELDPIPIPAGDLWERIVGGYAIPEVTDAELVHKWEQWYADRPDYVARMVERSRRYLYHIVVELELRGMPADIALLPMIESAFNPGALSVARASGIWQFMPETGHTYGLKQNWWFDSRRDVLAATTSALDYLQNLHDEFDDWQLALAAYNWGEGNVRKAVARNKARGLPTDYASLTKLPVETRNYLPKLQAVKNIIADPQRYGIDLASVPDAPFFAVVKTNRKMDVKRAAELAELSVDEFLALNPQHNRPVIAGADEYAILLPTDKAEIFAAKLDLLDQPLVSWQAYRVKPGETLPQIAVKFGMSVETLRAVNGIGSNARVPVNHPLLVPSQRASVDGDESLAQTVFTTVPAGRTVYYTVRRGDTLSVVAARYGVTTADLRRWNSMGQSAVRVGQKLRITSEAVSTHRSASVGPTVTSGSQNRTSGRQRGKSAANDRTPPSRGKTHATAKSKSVRTDTAAERSAKPAAHGRNGSLAGVGAKTRSPASRTVLTRGD
ncbi:MAG TPA: LysM peptidoglycan-binding domain-containing protein [Casimicrobiaceae bacterium]|nr:LysM peptidoglycan-binding domain-containing protein [Casimicrobiaceae bacterium]